MNKSIFKSITYFMSLITLLISGIDNSLLSSNNLFKASETSESVKFISSKIIQKPSLTALTRKLH